MHPFTHLSLNADAARTCCRANVATAAAQQSITDRSGRVSCLAHRCGLPRLLFPASSIRARPFASGAPLPRFIRNAGMSVAGTNCNDSGPGSCVTRWRARSAAIPWTYDRWVAARSLPAARSRSAKRYQPGRPRSLRLTSTATARARCCATSAAAGCASVACRSPTGITRSASTALRRVPPITHRQHELRNAQLHHCVTKTRTN